MNIPVKICGITSLKDAKIAVNYGASAIGLIFFQGSPRYVDPGKVKNWILDIPTLLIQAMTAVADRLLLDLIIPHLKEILGFLHCYTIPMTPIPT